MHEYTPRYPEQSHSICTCGLAESYHPVVGTYGTSMEFTVPMTPGHRERPYWIVLTVVYAFEAMAFALLMAPMMALLMILAAMAAAYLDITKEA